MLGSWICPIERTPVIIQVVSQLLPRVTPEKIHKEVSHCLGLDQDTCSYTLKHLRMVQLPIPAIHLWLASFFNLLLYIGGAYIGFTETWILASTPGQFMKSPHTHTGLTAIFPMDGAPLCAHHTLFPSTFCQFSHTQALPRMFRIQSHRHIWMQLPTLSPTSWSDSASTPAPEALLLGGWHTHWRPTTTLQLPPATFHSCTHAHLHLQPDHAAFGPTCPSLPFQHLGQFGPPLAPKAILLV